MVTPAVLYIGLKNVLTDYQDVGANFKYKRHSNRHIEDAVEAAVMMLLGPIHHSLQACRTLGYEGFEYGMHHKWYACNWCKRMPRAHHQENQRP
jgi:hypothetical protein